MRSTTHRLLRHGGLLAGLLVLAGCASVAPTRHDSLAAHIDAYVAQPRFASAFWGISVVSLDSGRVVYAHNAGKLAVPASNAKLYTAALALDALGGDHRVRTSLYATAETGPDGILDGDLILYGRGDPALGRGDDTHPPTAWADRLAATLAARGVRRVRGAVIGDDTAFAGPPIGPGWEANDLQTDFAPPASALSVQENVFILRVDATRGHCCEVSVDPAVVGVQVVNLATDPPAGAPVDIGLYRPPGSTQVFVQGSLPVAAPPRDYTLAAPDPALMAAGLLRDALARHGIAVDGGARAVRWPSRDAAMHGPALVHVADLDSPPLAELVKHALKHSDNLYAQLLLLQVGADADDSCADPAPLPRTTAERGLCALRALLGRIGIGADAAVFEEGSGLSRKDLVTPAATTALLAWASRQPFAAALYDALPIAGVDGTLRNRLRGTAAAGNLRGKTGSLTWTWTLAGYVTDAAGERLAFALMLDNYQPSGPAPRTDLDAIAGMLAGNGARRR